MNTRFIKLLLALSIIFTATCTTYAADYTKWAKHSRIVIKMKDTDNRISSPNLDTFDSIAKKLNSSPKKMFGDYLV